MLRVTALSACLLGIVCSPAVASGVRSVELPVPSSAYPGTGKALRVSFDSAAGQASATVLRQAPRESWEPFALYYNGQTLYLRGMGRPGKGTVVIRIGDDGDKVTWSVVGYAGSVTTPFSIDASGMTGTASFTNAALRGRRLTQVKPKDIALDAWPLEGDESAYLSLTPLTVANANQQFWKAVMRWSGKKAARQEPGQGAACELWTSNEAYCETKVIRGKQRWKVTSYVYPNRPAMLKGKTAWYVNKVRSKQLPPLLPTG